MGTLSTGLTFIVVLPGVPAVDQLTMCFGPAMKAEVAVCLFLG